MSAQVSALPKGKGYIKDPPHRRTQRLAHDVHGDQASTPAEASLEKYEELMTDQGQSGSCFPAGTMILMADFTERPIEEIGEWNSVRTHTGHSRKVTRVIRRLYEGEMISLHVKGYAYPLTMTPEHPIAVFQNIASRQSKFEPGEIEWKEAKDVRPKDVVLMPAKTLGHETGDGAMVDVLRFIEGETWQVEGEDRVRILDGRKSHTIPRHIRMTEDFARFMGLFLAEGSYEKHDGDPIGMNFTFARHEDAYQQFVIAAASSVFGCEAKLVKQESRSSVTDVTIHNATLARFVYGMCGEYALHKRVPMPFFSAPRNVQIALLRGWLEGDGTQDCLYAYRKSACVMGSTSSERLHRGLFRIAMLCGMKPGANVRNKIEEHQNAQPRGLGFYSDDILTIFPDKKEQIEGRGISVGSYKKYWRTDHGFACRVESVSVSETEEPIEVFNLEVEGEHTYVANGVAVHNCTYHGTPMAMCITANAAGKPLPFFPSPKTGYTILRTVERAKASDPLTDSGAMPSDIGPTAQTFGVRPMQGPTPDGRNSDIWTNDDLRGVANAPPANVNTEENLGDLLVAGQRLVVGITRVDETRSDFLAQIEAAIARGCAVGIGVFVDAAFESWSPTAQPEGLKSVNFADPNGGGHWICLDAYKTNADGSKTYSGPNSWSNSWGAGPLVDQSCPNKGGHWRATDAWMKAQAAQGMDIYIFDTVGGAS